jgi:hypothetical protein
MENIEIAQKINNLAKELVKNKIATNYEEACRQAETMIVGKVEKKEEVQNKENEELSKDVRKLNVATRDIAQEIMKLRDDLGKFQQEFNSIRDEVNSLKSKMFKMSADNRVREEMKKEEPERIVSKEDAAKEHITKMSQPKEPEKVDLSIENIFYYGDKKHV